MENYTKVKTTYYGAMVGLDWDRQYSDNFDATYGIFASYIGGELKDDNWEEGDYKVKQNGGYIGLRGNWYFGKLFVNGIVDYGMIANGADNPYDSSDFNSSVIGLAARVGYNFEVANKRFTIQPGVGVTGKYIISDDFETKLKDDSKIKEEIDDIKNITVEPGLKLALNLGKCWILTGEGKYVIENYDGDTKVKGEGLDFVLPDMSYKNYTSCGLGIEKIWGYTVLHVKGNKTFGGRDGFIVNAGIEFKF
jgi:outer membrane autotransporter protein